MSRCIRAASSTSSRHCQVTQTVSPQPETFDIAVQLQKEDLKETPSCYPNKRGSHRDREQPSHGFMILPFSPYCPQVTTVRLFPRIDMVLQANVNQEYPPQATSVYAKCSDICNGILGLIRCINEQMIFSIYKVNPMQFYQNNFK